MATVTRLTAWPPLVECREVLGRWGLPYTVQTRGGRSIDEGYPTYPEDLIAQGRRHDAGRKGE